MKTQLIELITKRGPGLTFVEMQKHLKGFAGDKVMCFNEPYENIVLWANISSEVVDAICELCTENKIHFRPTSPLVYLADGAMMQLPLAKHKRTYKEPHWLPVAFYLGPLPKDFSGFRCVRGR